MQEEKTEGIVLRSQDYKERHRIVTLFTPQGLISLIVRNISRKNTRLLSLTTPFSHGEYLYQRGRSELLSFRDGTLLDGHLDLRHTLKALQTAGSLAHAILSSQMASKPAPALFALTTCTTNRSPILQIPNSSSPAFPSNSSNMKDSSPFPLTAATATTPPPRVSTREKASAKPTPPKTPSVFSLPNGNYCSPSIKLFNFPPYKGSPSLPIFAKKSRPFPSPASGIDIKNNPLYL